MGARWQSWSVGVDEIRKLEGTLMREGLSGDAVILVTLSHFTEPVIAEFREQERVSHCGFAGR